MNRECIVFWALIIIAISCIISEMVLRCQKKDSTNLKIWVFPTLIILFIYLTRVIERVINIINIDNDLFKSESTQYSNLAWPYLTQIFGLLFILGVIGIFAYTLVKISKDD